MEQEGRVAADQDDAALIAYHQLRADGIRQTRAQMAEILVPDRIARRDLCARPGVDADRAAIAHEHRVLRNRPRRFAHEARRSEEHTSELQSLMRISYDVFCLKK